MVADHAFAQGGQLGVRGMGAGTETLVHRAAQVLLDRGLVLRGRWDQGGGGDVSVGVEAVAVVEEPAGASVAPWPVPVRAGTSKYGRGGGS